MMRQETMNRESDRVWRKSSRSGTTDSKVNCVEVADNNGAANVYVRDSKDRAGGELSMPRGEWASVVAFAKERDLS